MLLVRRAVCWKANRAIELAWGDVAVLRAKIMLGAIDEEVASIANAWQMQISQFMSLVLISLLMLSECKWVIAPPVVLPIN